MENLSDRAEEILERLWTELVEEKKERCDVSILKDDDSLRELVDLDCVEIKDNQITLTPKGTEEAKSCVRRHRLAERLLADVLDLKKKLVHQTSCQFEHLLHKGLDDDICTLLGHPKTCPHGRPIPEGECCRDFRKELTKLISPLSELLPNEKGKIAYIHTEDRHILKKLMSMGTLPGVSITLLQRFPSYVFQIGKSQFAIDKELASHIYVRIS